MSTRYKVKAYDERSMAHLLTSNINDDIILVDLMIAGDNPDLKKPEDWIGLDVECESLYPCLFLARGVKVIK